MNVIEKGKRNVEILKQNQADPFTVENQVAIIYAGSKNLLKDVPVNKVKEFEGRLYRIFKCKAPRCIRYFKSWKTYR